MIDTVALGLVTECKAAVKEDGNPDGLHWSDFAALVAQALVAQFPKSRR